MQGPSGWLIVANKIIIEGVNGELLVYSGTPALGNLEASIAGAAGTDSVNNAFVMGVAAYTGSGSSWFATALQGGFITSFFSTSASGPWSLVGQINFASNGALNIDFPFISLTSTQTGLIQGAGAIPHSAAGITTVAQLVSALQTVGILD
jgi:hypothetical protein